jgi:chromosome segregation ATPase
LTLKKSLFVLLLFCSLVCLPGTTFAAEETYQMTEAELTQLQANLTQLASNNQQQQAVLATQAQQLVTLKAQLTQSQADLETLKTQLATSQAELQQAKTSLQAAQTSLQAANKSFQAYERAVNRNLEIGAGAGVFDGKTVSVLAIEYDAKNVAYEVIGNKTDAIGLIKYRF